MKKDPENIIDKQFETLRHEPAISEQEIRTLVSGPVPPASFNPDSWLSRISTKVWISNPWFIGLAVMGIVGLTALMIALIGGEQTRAPQPQHADSQQTIVPPGGDNDRDNETSVAGLPVDSHSVSVPGEPSSPPSPTPRQGSGMLLQDSPTAAHEIIEEQPPVDEVVASVENASPISTEATTSSTDSVIRFISPNGGEVFYGGARNIIQWQGLTDQETALIEISINGGRTWVPIGGNIPGSEYTWRIPKLDSDSCLARLTVTSDYGSELTLEGHTGWINSAIFSPSGKLAATNGDDSTTKIWDAATGALLQTLVGHTGDIFWSAFSPNDELIATAGGDSTLRVWDVRTGTLRHTLRGHTGQLTHCAFSPDGKHLASSGDGGNVIIWDPYSGNQARILQSGERGVHTVEYNRSGDRIVTAGGDSTIRIWDTTGTQLNSLAGHTAMVNSAMYNSDGTRIVSAGRDSTVRIWDARTGELQLTIDDYRCWIWDATFSPDDRYVATGDNAGFVKVWDTETGRLLQSWYAHNGVVGGARFHPDGRLITGANDQLGRVWKIDPTKQVRSIVSDSYWSIVAVDQFNENNTQE